MRKIITFQKEFLPYPGSIDLLDTIKTRALLHQDQVQIAIETPLVKNPWLLELKAQGLIDFIMSPEIFRKGAMAVGLVKYFWLEKENEIAKRNKGNPDWEMLAEAGALMGLPTDKISLQRLHDNYWRWQRAEEKHDAAYFSPLFFMMAEGDKGMAVNYDWGSYKRSESIKTPLFRRVEIHLRGNRELSLDEGLALINYPSTEIMEILENAGTGKTKELMLKELAELINNWDGNPFFYDLGESWGIYTEGSEIFRQAETWLRGELGISWRKSKERE